MPIKVICSNCGYQLAFYRKLPDYARLESIPYYVQIREEHNGKCPKCRHKLAKKPVSLEIKATDQKTMGVRQWLAKEKAGFSEEKTTNT